LRTDIAGTHRALKERGREKNVRGYFRVRDDSSDEINWYAVDMPQRGMSGFNKATTRHARTSTAKTRHALRTTRITRARRAVSWHDRTTTVDNSPYYR